MGVSAVEWSLECLLDEKPRPFDFVARVELLNRYKESHRCRPLACEVVNKLAPMCLSGPPEFWNTTVNGKTVWSPLRPNSSLTPFEAFLASNTTEVVSISPAQPTTTRAMTGYHGKSRY